MSKLITNQNDITDAETADLVFTYNELEGKSITKFESRGAAERRVANAILAAADRAGHKGVKAGKEPQVADGKASKNEAKQDQKPVADGKVTKGTKEVAQKAAAKASKQAQVESGAKNKADTKAKAPKAPKKPKGVKVMTATDLASTQTGLRPDSFRGQILQTIIDNPGMAKSAIVEHHGAYTADVLCKFKRLGFITEKVVAEE